MQNINPSDMPLMTSGHDNFYRNLGIIIENFRVEHDLGVAVMCEILDVTEENYARLVRGKYELGVYGFLCLCDITRWDPCTVAIVAVNDDDTNAKH